MNYQAHDILTGQAQPRAELWRTGIGVLILVAGTLVLTAVWVMAVPLFGPPGPGRLIPGETPTGMIWILASFLCPLVMLALVMRTLHGRTLGSLIGPLPLAGQQFLRVLPVPLGVLGLALILPSPGGHDLVANLPLSAWLVWLGPALLLLVVQVGTEELIFRGYLQSQLAARVRSPLVWLVLPSLVFAVLHFDATAGANRWLIVGVTGLFSLCVADLTARAGTLGPAMALHLVNNFGSLMLVGAMGPMQGLALYVVPVDMSDPVLRPALVAEALLIIIMWLGARIVLRR
ncbi:lysostaphin resistance A-like protein [Pseudooceanicola sp.]|uniref:lysostaphin resistance A-like protein n=1 Tax=Pseudooceanicola sp. TaxID=1914328 RepID=UPI0035C6B611